MIELAFDLVLLVVAGCIVLLILAPLLEFVIGPTLENINNFCLAVFTRVADWWER